jgi:hypothetical protein
VRRRDRHDQRVQDDEKKDRPGDDGSAVPEIPPNRVSPQAGLTDGRPRLGHGDLGTARDQPFLAERLFLRIDDH